MSARDDAGHADVVEAVRDAMADDDSSDVRCQADVIYHRNVGDVVEIKRVVVRTTDDETAFKALVADGWTCMQIQTEPTYVGICFTGVEVVAYLVKTKPDEEADTVA